MDPVTIISGATMAFNALKKGFAVGKDLQDMSGQLTQWASAMSDLGHVEKKAKNPPWWKTIRGDVEQEALAIFAAKRKAEAMREELRQHISFTMGPSAWDELVRIEARIRKEKKDREYRQEEIKETIITWTLGSLLLLAGMGGMALVLYFIGKSQGKW
jgi:hypothetical protein